MKNLKQLKSTIADQNPWWTDHFVPDYLAHSRERPLSKYLRKRILSSSLKRHLIILGPRRVGKTTVMYQTVRHLLNNNIPPEKIQWVRLDHPFIMPIDLGTIVKEAMKLAQADQKKPLYLFLDELVYAENWDKWLKTFYDEHWPVNIIASSSATAALQKGKESGVGRWEEFHLTPYNLTELLHLYDKDVQIPNEIKKQDLSLHDTIKNLSESLPHTQINFENERKILLSLGGFPEFLIENKRMNELLDRRKKRLLSESNLLTSEKQSDVEILYQKHRERIANSIFQRTQQMLRSDAIEKAIYKDLPQSYRIENPINLEKLLYVLADQMTGLLSRKGISEDISQMSVSTLDRYLSYLIQTYLVFTISNYSSIERNTQRRQKKVYFVDSAIRNVALFRDMEKMFKDSSELGKLQENLVARHLYHLGQQLNIRLYYWKREKYEVDFIYDDPVQPLAFEIGTSKNHSFSGLKNFLKNNSKFRKGTYYVAPNLQFLSVEESSSGIGELPLDLLLLAIGIKQNKMFSS